MLGSIIVVFWLKHCSIGGRNTDVRWTDDGCVITHVFSTVIVCMSVVRRQEHICFFIKIWQQIVLHNIDDELFQTLTTSSIQPPLNRFPFPLQLSRDIVESSCLVTTSHGVSPICLNFVARINYSHALV